MACSSVSTAARSRSTCRATLRSRSSPSALTRCSTKRSRSPRRASTRRKTSVRGLLLLLAGAPTRIAKVPPTKAAALAAALAARRLRPTATTVAEAARRPWPTFGPGTKRTTRRRIRRKLRSCASKRTISRKMTGGSWAAPAQKTAPAQKRAEGSTRTAESASRLSLQSHLCNLCRRISCRAIAASNSRQ